MKTLKDFKQHYEGFDASLSISLFEYGFIFSYTDPLSGGDLRVWMKHRHGYDWADFKPSLDFWRQFAWIEDSSKASFLSYLGMSQAEFDASPLEQKIYDAIGYFGAEEVCGSASRQFEILEDGPTPNNDGGASE